MVKLAFKKGDGLLSSIIKYLTKSPYSHVELIVGNKWISSSPEDGGLYIRNLKPLKNNWDYIDITDKVENIDYALSFAYSQIGTKYDYLGIIRIFTGITKKNNKWFCSEIVTVLLQKQQVEEVLFLNPSHTTPGDLYDLFKE